MRVVVKCTLGKTFGKGRAHLPRVWSPSLTEVIGLGQTYLSPHNSFSLLWTQHRLALAEKLAACVSIVELFSSFEVPGVVMSFFDSISLIDNLHKALFTRLNSSTCLLIIVFYFSFLLRTSETSVPSG